MANPANEPPRDGAPLPPADEDASGDFRMKVLLAGIAVLLVAILVIVAVLVATRERTVPRGPNPPVSTFPRAQAAASESRRVPRVRSGRQFAMGFFALDSLTPRGGA